MIMKYKNLIVHILILTMIELFSGRILGLRLGYWIIIYTDKYNKMN